MVNAPKGVNFVHYTWEQFDADIEKIARAVEASGRKFTKIFGVPRGGAPLAVCLSHRLGLDFYPGLDVLRDLNREEEKILHYQNMELMSDEKKPKEILREKVDRIMVVDDLSDTGQQLQPYRDRGFFIATLHKKPWTKVEPDIWITEETGWVVYPWEKSLLK